LPFFGQEGDRVKIYIGLNTPSMEPRGLKPDETIQTPF